VLRIGAFCSIVDGVQIFLGGEHRTDWVTTFPFSAKWPAAKHIVGHPSTKGDVVIGNDVWIGQGATVMSGVTIGDGAVVGACSLVATDVPPYTVVGGNPARPLGTRFNEATIRRLLAMRWWDWDNARIERFLPLMLNDQIEDFLLAAEGAAQPPRAAN
jgi:acetyltransferase-like isoleucine patch superfamily enzyme